MLNRVVLVGRITKEIEMKYSQSGKAYAKFTLAVNRTFKDANGEQRADFIQIAVFGKTAENTADYCKKGSLVGVDGRIQTGSYEKDNVRIYTTDVIADNVQFLDTRSQNDTQQGGYQQPQPQYQQQNNYQPSQQRQGNYNNSAQGNEPFAQGNVNVSDDNLPF